MPVIRAPHPSPQNLNTRPELRESILDALIEAKAMASGVAPNATRPPETPRSKLERVPLSELFGRYGAILAELRRREIVRTNNAPAGDWAEYLICAYLEGTLAPNSEKSWDVLSPDKTTRVQVKARVIFDPFNQGQRQLSTIRSFDFDSLAIVLFDDAFTVWRAVLLPVAAVMQHAAPNPYLNGHRLIATDVLLDSPQGKDITEALQQMAANL